MSSRRFLAGISAVLFCVALARGSEGEVPCAALTDAVHRLASRYDAFAMVPDDPQGRVVYGTNRGYLHLLRSVGSRYREIWVSPSHVTRIQKVLISDLQGSGTPQVVAFTVRGLIVVYDLGSFGLIWQSPEQQFRSIEVLTVANTDNDRQQEIIFLSEGRLYVYDGMHFIEEWRSDALYDARDIAVGDVDGDGEPEIVLSSGHVLDARYHSLKWQNKEPFGDHLELADIDGDGKMEVIASTNDAVTIWDVDERHEKWD